MYHSLIIKIQNLETIQLPINSRVDLKYSGVIIHWDSTQHWKKMNNSSKHNMDESHRHDDEQKTAMHKSCTHRDTTYRSFNTR